MPSLWSLLLLAPLGVLATQNDNIMAPDFYASLDNVTLVDLLPVAPDAGENRGSLTDVKLKNEATMHWAADNARAVVHATFDGNDEFVLNTELFADSLGTVSCTPAGIEMQFTDLGAFEDAVKGWDWVNQEHINHIFFITSHPGCSVEHSRGVYNVSAITFDSGKQSAVLSGSALAFEDVIHDGQIVIESFPDTSGDLEKRVSGGASVHINKKFTGDIHHDHSFALKCTDCAAVVSGTVRVTVDISFFHISEAYVELTANAEVTAALELQVKSSITKSGELIIVSSPYGFNILGVVQVSIGPNFGVGWTGTLSGAGQVTWGASAQLAKNSYAKICLKGCSSKSSGWSMSRHIDSPTFQGSLEAQLSVYPFIDVSARLKALGTGFAAGVEARVPDFRGTFIAHVNPHGGICNNPAFVLGLTSSVDVGVSVDAFAGSHTYPIFSAFAPLYSGCIGAA